MDYSALLYGPIYDALGVEADLVLDDTATTLITVMAIDKTAGVAVQAADNVEVQSIIPAAIVRMSELTENGVAADDLDRATLTLKPDGLPESEWTVKSHRPVPSPKGEADGEIYLFLEAA